MSTTGRIGRYLIDRKLSEGGMAEVFLARTDNVVGFDKRVVLKCVSQKHADDPRFTAMLVQEARIAAALDHAHIVQVLDLVEDQGRHFIVMEMLDGQTTRSMLKRAAQLKVRIAPGVSCRVIADLLGGLAYAHDRRGADGQPLGLVHRDVSPANVVVTWSGGVKLIDFGIAKATEQLGEELTRAGQRKGKSAYMSPEQVRGLPLDRRSDLFSTGILLWELLTGRRLFSRPNDVDSMLAICKEDTLPPSTLVPGLPPALDAIVQRALTRDPEARYSDASIMRRDLEALILEQRWDSSPLAVERQLAALFTTTFDDDPTTARPPRPVEKPAVQIVDDLPTEKSKRESSPAEEIFGSDPTPVATPGEPAAREHAAPSEPALAREDATPVVAIPVVANPAVSPSDMVTPKVTPRMVTPKMLTPEIVTPEIGAPAKVTPPIAACASDGSESPATGAEPAHSVDVSLDSFAAFTVVKPPQVAASTEARVADGAPAQVRSIFDGWATDQMSAAPVPVRKHRLRALLAAVACFAIGAAGCAAAVHYFG